MKIASKIKKKLQSGEMYTSSELWQLVNGARVLKKIITITEQILSNLFMSVPFANFC